MIESINSLSENQVVLEADKLTKRYEDGVLARLSLLGMFKKISN
jgi:hypothetical protein